MGDMLAGMKQEAQGWSEVVSGSVAQVKAREEAGLGP